MTAEVQQQVDQDQDQQGGDNVAAYDGKVETTVGGRRGRRRGSKRRGSKRVTRKGRKGSRKAPKRKGTKKKRGQSPWIKHVLAFCKKTGKSFPEALADPMCKKTYKH